MSQVNMNGLTKTYKLTFASTPQWHSGSSTYCLCGSSDSDFICCIWNIYNSSLNINGFTSNREHSKLKVFTALSKEDHTSRQEFASMVYESILKIIAIRINGRSPNLKANMASRRLYIHRKFTRNTTHPLFLKYFLQSISKTSSRIYVSKGVGVTMITKFLLPNT